MMLVSVLDVVIAVVLGSVAAVLYKRRYRERSENWYLGATLLVVFLLWCNLIAGNFLGTAYWSLGAPVVQLPSGVGAVYVLSYPLWFRAAGEVTFILVGRRPDQGGILWVFRLRDRTAPISPSWKSSEVTESTDNGREDESK